MVGVELLVRLRGLLKGMDCLGGKREILNGKFVVVVWKWG